SVDDATLVRKSATKDLQGDPNESADQKLIAMRAAEGGDNFGRHLVVTHEGKPVKSFTYKFLVDTVAWMRDRSGLFMITEGPETHFRPQIMFQPYPGGDLVRVTNDFTLYSGLTMTTDSKVLLTVQKQIKQNELVGEVPE